MPADPGQPLHPQFVTRLISQIADQDAVFTCDVGTPTVWAARYLRMNGKRRLLGSFNHGSMANAMPQALGAQAAFPGRQVISLSGDGGFAMLMGDFISLAQLHLPVKVVVFNNASLGFVAMADIFLFGWSESPVAHQLSTYQLSPAACIQDKFFHAAAENIVFTSTIDAPLTHAQKQRSTHWKARATALLRVAQGYRKVVFAP